LALIGLWNWMRRHSTVDHLAQPSNPVAYFLTAAHHAASDLYRQERRGAHQLSIDLEDIPQVSDSRQRAYAEEVDDVIAAAIKALPARYRRVFLALTNPENRATRKGELLKAVAAQLQMTPAAVRCIEQRAIDRLREQVGAGIPPGRRARIRTTGAGSETERLRRAA
jgi:RNA polymerase sigma factor (sigma-70 family)